MKTIPKKLEPLAQEARKYKSAEEFVNEFIRNTPQKEVRDIVSQFDKVVNKLNQQLTGKEIKMSEDVNLGLKAKKTAQMWACTTRSINAIDRKLFTETKRALINFYDQFIS
jgi:NifU-like protein involved in Fe-S cluster formation